MRVKRIFVRGGLAYIGYHILADLVLVGSAVHNVAPGYWWTRDFLLEYSLTVFFYPVIVPALIACGGLHNTCETVLGRAPNGQSWA